ncbi:WD40-repeat-containing domain protein [Suillus paluster]|uniref:WD40-repeat-containing domain protein n=1 Tax=Suillus paluster TaxID=48578 RepID=UPI001B87834F|nr:WD40-repeat-containing domain protein [Suillus paluster]KAG1743345.1 WD40-repeat-containing domain protein [Suillus paluster]
MRGEGNNVGIALSPNGNIIGNGSDDGKVRLWDVETGKVIAKWTGHMRVWSVCWSADGERVACASSLEGGTVRVWDIESRRTVLTIKTGHESVWQVINSPDSTIIATGGYNENSVKIWDAMTGELLDTLKHDEEVIRLAWTSDNKKLISSSLGGSIRIFDTTSWEQIAILEGHSYSVISISLFRNNCLLASASEDNTARLWNLDTNLPVGPPLPHKNHARCAAFSVDGTRLVTGSDDGNAYVWDIYAILKEAGLEELLSIPDVPVGKSSKNTDATQRPAQLKDARRLPPGFFDSVRDGIHSSATRNTHPRSSTGHALTLSSSSANPHTLFGRLLSLFRHSHSNTGEATELQQRPARTLFSPRGRHVVDISAVRDKRALVVAPRRDQAKRPQQQQSKSQGRAQASSSQSQPVVASTSATSHTPDSSTTTPGPTGTQSRPVPLWARFVLFLCCASPPHTNGH